MRQQSLSAPSTVDPPAMRAHRRLEAALLARAAKGEARCSLRKLIVLLGALSFAQAFVSDRERCRRNLETTETGQRIMTEFRNQEAKRAMLRHTIATLAYRGGKAVMNAPHGFATFSIGESTRTPAEILAHIGDLLDWALWQAKGKHVWHSSTPLPWQEEVARFFAALEQLDAFLASDEPLGYDAEKIFQGPIADALTHVGQIALLRRLAGAPVRGENYFKAEIVAGRVGPEQSKVRVEFE
jgi:hypothetical protein